MKIPKQFTIHGHTINIRVVEVDEKTDMVITITLEKKF